MKKAIKQLHIVRGLFIMIMAMFLWINMTVSIYATEQSGSCGENLNWKISGETLIISGKGDMSDYSEGHLPPWNTITERIKTISLSSDVTSIGDLAFYGCQNLIEISIPKSVTKIGDYAFAGCTNLNYVNLECVESIEEGAFQQCESLGKVEFSSTLQLIGSKAFYRCYELGSITIPSSVTELGTSVFAYCENLVRATINAPLSELPVWTFYGCSSLTDVSLNPMTSSVGEYAFKDCDNLNGIYIKDGSEETALKIEKSIDKSNDDNEKQEYTEQDDEELQLDEKEVDPFVVTHDMPNSSTVTSEDSNQYVSVSIVQKDDLSITVEEILDYSEGIGKRSRTIKAFVKDNEEWKNVVAVVDDEINSVKSGSIIVDIQLMDNTIDGEMLAKYAGKPITLRIKISNGTIWKLEMSDFSADDFSGIYDLGVEVTKTESGETTIGSDTVYKVKFKNYVDFNATVGLQQGNVHDKATLFVKEGGSYNLISTMLVDEEGYAWFALAGVDKNAKYYIGMNVEKITIEDVTIPETMYEQYGLEEGTSYLMDSDGMQYRITGRSSRWGITGKQFAMYVAAAIGVTVLIVGSVMLAMNIIKKSREKYERMAEEDALREKEEEDALRLEIMKELLGENNDKVN